MRAKNPVIRIKTNIEQVQQRLRRLEVELHKALLRALDIKEWRNALSVSAEKVLKKQWQMERDVELRAFYERMKWPSGLWRSWGWATQSCRART